MNTDRLNEEAIFLGALDKATPEERAAFLDGMCAGDSQLRQRLEALLESHQHADGFLTNPPVDRDSFSRTPGNIDEPDASSMGLLLTITEGPGTSIGRYKLLQEIGEGGFGVVYMAEQREPVQRRVALKIIKVGMDTKQVIGRFEAERQALAMMDHPNIARVLDVGATDAGRPYFVMELVKGVPITEFCDQNRFNTRERLQLFAQVCSAVQHAHQKGIIHRDIKPSNVMVTLHDDKPIVKVIDFGIAKATEQRLTEKTVFTEFKQFIGTPAYMSPEQARLSGLDIDTRSDIYALGVLLYELLTGTTPFYEEQLRGLAYDELCRVIREEPHATPSIRVSTLGEQLAFVSESRATEPSVLCRLLRGDIDWVVMKSLEKDRQRRYETANALAMDIQRYLGNEPVLAGPPTALYRVRKFVARNRTAVVSFSAVVAALIIGTVGATIGLVKAREAKHDADVAKERLQQQLVQTQDARDREKDARQEASQNLYASDMNSVHEAYGGGDIRRALALLERHRSAYQERFEWRYLWRLCQEGDSLHTIPNLSSSAAISADGVLAAKSADGYVKLFDMNQQVQQGDSGSGRRAAGPMEIARLKHEGEIYSLTFSPDGQTLAVGTKEGLVTLWQTKTRTKIETIDKGGSVYGLAFSPGGKILAIGSYNGLLLWDPSTGKELPGMMVGVEMDSDGVGKLVFSPDGRLLAGNSGRLHFHLWDMVGLRQLEPLRNPHASYSSALAFSPDGRVLATGSWDSEIKLWDSQTKALLRTFKGHQARINWLTFSPDGNTLASASDDGTVRLWPARDRQPGDGEASAMLRGHTANVSFVAFVPDGETLVSASSDATVKIWPAHGIPDRDVLAEDSDWVDTVAFSPNDMLATGCYDGTVRLCDAQTLETIEVFKAHEHQVSVVDFSPSGQWLASCDCTKRVNDHWNYAAPGQVILTKIGNHWKQVSVPDITTGIEVVRFSPDRRTIAFGDRDGMLTLWDIDDQRSSLSIATDWGRVQNVRFSPDGKTMATAHGQRGPVEKPFIVKLWDVTTGDPLAVLEKTTGEGVAFSPDGRTLATGSEDHSIKLWDLSTQRELTRLPGHKGYVMDIRFSPDGHTLATCSVDHTIRLWSVESGQNVATLKGHSGPVSGLAFSHDGTALASSSADKTVRLWRAPHLSAR